MNILSRDGNGVARISWIESLYEKEWVELSKLSKELKECIQQGAAESVLERNRALKIYHACMKEAYFNDEKNTSNCHCKWRNTLLCVFPVNIR